MSRKKRSRSAPPFSARDLGGWALREEYIDSFENLHMDPADLAEFSSVEIFKGRPASLPRTMYWVDNDKVLKLFSYLVDVTVIVAIMDLAGTKVPVPRVLRYGQSGNCSFILMEKVPHVSLSAAMKHWGLNYMPPRVTYWIDYVVRELASLGLSHNDLVPRNILVDGNGTIVSIVDWDTCTPHHASFEYAKMISSIRFQFTRDLGEEHWYHSFLRYSFDRTGEEIAMDCSRRHPNLLHQWPLVKSKASQLVSLSITDPRNQSFSRQEKLPVYNTQIRGKS